MERRRRTASGLVQPAEGLVPAEPVLVPVEAERPPILPAARPEMTQTAPDLKPPAREALASAALALEEPALGALAHRAGRRRAPTVARATVVHHLAVPPHCRFRDTNPRLRREVRYHLREPGQTTSLRLRLLECSLVLAFATNGWCIVFDCWPTQKIALEGECLGRLRVR